MRAARFVLLLPGLVLALSGCFDDGPPDVPTDTVRASFPPGGVADVIQIDAVEPLALRAAELVAPDGAATAATSIETNPAPTIPGGQFVTNSPFQGGGLPMPAAPGLAVSSTGIGATALQSRTRLIATVSYATIALPDPVAYRRDWAQYSIRLTFGDPPNSTETRTIPAPAPPAGG